MIDIDRMALEEGISKEEIIRLLLPVHGPTIEDVCEIYGSAMQGSDEQEHALFIWQILSNEQINNVRTVEDACQAYHDAPWKSEEQKRAINVWLSLCSKAKDAFMVYNAAPCNSEEQREAMALWRKLSNEEIDAASTFEASCEAFCDAPWKTGEQIKGMKKALSFCIFSTQARIAHGYTTEGREEEVLAMARWRELSAKEVAHANTLDLVREVYKNAPDRSKEKRLALAKIASWYKKE